MATVVQFKARAPRDPKPYTSPHDTAELVLFPGVRYERWDDSEEQASTAGRSRTRDHLDLDA